MDSKLKKIYYDPQNPAAFSSVNNLYEATDKKYSKTAIKQWLSKQLTYTLHKPARLNYKKRQYVTNNIGDFFEIDLVDLSSIAEFNDGIKYILTVIDVFSKFAFTVPIKSKTSTSVINAFKIILNSIKYKPYNISSDRGKEFVNDTFQNFLKSKRINYFNPSDDTTKCSIVERFNLTLKHLLFKYMTSKNSLKYIDALQSLTKSYNTRKHRSIGIAPVNVKNNNILSVWKYSRRHKQKLKEKKPKFAIATHVRISKNKKATQFNKGYNPNYSDEIFMIRAVIKSQPPTYRLKDLQDENIDGIFYEEELQNVIMDKNTVFRVEKIIGKRKYRNINQVKVVWKGWPEKFSSWINAKDINTSE